MWEDNQSVSHWQPKSAHLRLRRGVARSVVQIGTPGMSTSLHFLGRDSASETSRGGSIEVVKPHRFVTAESFLERAPTAQRLSLLDPSLPYLR